MEKLKLLLLAFFIGFSINSWAQTTQVSGVVLDEQNVPLSGANVQVSGTTNVVVTDFDGKFKITVLNKNTTLVISYVGFADQRVKLDGSKTNYTIKLVANATGLEQVVVVGYGKGSRKNLTT
ncbi:MAG TPA: carboxypeptidase-like regulatory domain-containing protein, partial [Flavobacterium sp.]